MNRDTERHRLVTRRALMLGGLKLSLGAGLAARLYQLQVIESEKFSVLAEENRISLRLVAPSRGLIVDRFGVPLAVNRQNFQLVVVPERTPQLDRVLGLLSEIIAFSQSDRRRIARDLERRRRFVPVTLKENLTWDQVSTIELNAPDLPGVSIEVGEIRQYPHGEATAHILGYVGAVSEQDLTGDPVLSLPGFRIGKAGIEKHHEKALRGVAGTVQLEVNAIGRVIRELNRTDGQPGREITLTLDVELQKLAQERIASERSAAAVILDVHTGGIYALASTPSFDPNLFSTGIDATTWRSLITDETSPLSNKATAGQYAPGSTFKMMVALAALEYGIITPHHRVFCPGSMKLGNHRFHCWRRGGHGTMDVVNAISQSCDVFFYDLGRRLGVDRLAEMCHRFGLGHVSGIEIPAERSGLIPTRDWKRRMLNASWQPGESLVAAIGQGYVLTTPLQLAVMTARLASGGYAVEPHLTKEIKQGPSERTRWPSLELNQDFLGLVLKGMNDVTNSRRGTAWRRRITEEGMEMAGKTGTAQVRRITKAERATGVIPNSRRPWKERDHALFVGFAPVHAPRYAISVIVEHGGGGSSVAAPIAHDLLLECQKRDPARTLVSATGRPAAEPDRS